LTLVLYQKGNDKS